MGGIHWISAGMRCGMSGGWGRIDHDNAVDAMLKYADAGCTTFDMADICNTSHRK